MLELRSASISYGAIAAVKNVSIQLRPGEIVAIIGANGAGKSTLLKGIAGLEPVHSGEILLEGQNLQQVPAHKRLALGIALSPEGRGVFPDQTVRENLVLGAYSSRLDKAALEERMGTQLQLFPRLAERMEQMAGTLSGGEQQMLAISRALMSQPRYLLLDEPSLGLAPLIIQDIFASIRKLRSLGVTILLVEQMAQQALTVCDRAYVLETGSIVLEGDGPSVKANPAVRAAYLGKH